jgi:hypothetical protein
MGSWDHNGINSYLTYFYIILLLFSKKTAPRLLGRLSLNRYRVLPVNEGVIEYYVRPLHLIVYFYRMNKYYIYIYILPDTNNYRAFSTPSPVNALHSQKSNPFSLAKVFAYSLVTSLMLVRSPLLPNKHIFM